MVLGGLVSVTLALKNGEPFQIWILDTGQPPDASDFASIEPEEKLRCLCRARERDRQAFVKTRAALRYLLGGAVRGSAEVDPLCAKSGNPSLWGKPSLAVVVENLGPGGVSVVPQKLQCVSR